MKFSSRRWRPRHLWVAWLVYWAGLSLVKLGPAITALVRMSRDPNSHGTASAGFANDMLSLTVTHAGAPGYTGSISLFSLVLLVAGPPLVIWLVWLVMVSRTNNAGDTPVRRINSRNELPAAEPRKGIVDASNPKRSALEES